MSIRLDKSIRLTLSHEFMRIPGTTNKAFLRSQPDKILDLSSDIYTFLAQFLHPKALGDVFPNPSQEQLDLLVFLIELGVLLRENEIPSRLPFRIVECSPRFLNAPHWKEDFNVRPSAVILGVPYDNNTLAAYERGTSRGPDSIREASVWLPCRYDLTTGRMIGYYDVDEERRLLDGTLIFDAGDLKASPSCSWSEFSSGLREQVKRIRLRGGMVVLLGGDHSITLPAVEALEDSAIGILHIDAHSDLAPINFLGDIHHGNVFRHIAALSKVKHIVLIGYRGIQLDSAALQRPAYEAFSVKRIRTLNAGQMGQICRKDLPYYISIDIDALDPSIAPATPAPVPEGFLLTEARSIIRNLVGECRILGIDLVEVLPDHNAAITSNSAVQLILEAISCALEQSANDNR